MRKIGMYFTIERCQMLAIWTFAVVWPAVRVPAMPNPDRAMRTTKTWTVSTSWMNLGGGFPWLSEPPVSQLWNCSHIHGTQKSDDPWTPAKHSSTHSYGEQKPFTSPKNLREVFLGKFHFTFTNKTWMTYFFGDFTFIGLLMFVYQLPFLQEISKDYFSFPLHFHFPRKLSGN